MPYLIIALLVLYAVSEAFNRRERGKLLNRIMAKDLPQFEYYENKFKKDVAEVERVRDEAREERTEAKKEIEDEDDFEKNY
jgi:hypothetical protein